MYRLLGASRTNFANFMRSSALRRPSGHKISAELLPCPVPFTFDSPPPAKGSRRQQIRFRERRALEMFVNLQVCAINFTFLGGPPCCPSQGCRGVLSVEQDKWVKGLWRRARSLCRLVGDLTGCGSKINDVQFSLDSLEAGFVSLSELVYGAIKQGSKSSTEGPGSSPVVPTVASKVAFPEVLADFDPSPFLPEPYLTAFTSPNLILRDLPPPQSMLPMTSPRTALWHLMHRWDAVNRFTLALECEAPILVRSNFFCLKKPDGELRQIIDRRPRNALEQGPPKESPKMGHCMGLIIPPNGCLRGSLDDLRNYYHAFKVSLERGLSTPVGPCWFARDFWNTKAMQVLREQLPHISITPSTKVVGCFGGLSTGDAWAPCIAQIARERVLSTVGVFLKNEHLSLGTPPYLGLLVVITLVCALTTKFPCRSFHSTFLLVPVLKVTPREMP